MDRACLFPYAVILQVTPLVAIAPLIIIWVKDIPLALLICAWIVAFFPIVSNTTLGLNSADHNLLNLFQLYGAIALAGAACTCGFPAALPYFLGGLRISGGLALIGAVVAEFVAGTGGADRAWPTGSSRPATTLDIPRMFAALVADLGAPASSSSWRCHVLSHLRPAQWHESARERERTHMMALGSVDGPAEPPLLAAERAACRPAA